MGQPPERLRRSPLGKGGAACGRAKPDPRRLLGESQPEHVPVAGRGGDEPFPEQW